MSEVQDIPVDVSVAPPVAKALRSQRVTWNRTLAGDKGPEYIKLTLTRTVVSEDGEEQTTELPVLLDSSSAIKLGLCCLEGSTLLGVAKEIGAELIDPEAATEALAAPAQGVAGYL